MGRVRENATYQDLIDVPDTMVGELIEGELYASPRPSGPHTVAASILGMSIGPPYHLGRGGPGGWWILDEPELHLGRDVLVPDIAGWRRERLPQIPENQVFSVAPDWVCEILSPSTDNLDRKKKMPMYARHEVAYAWMIDPAKRSLEARKLEDGRWTEIGYFSDDDKVRAEPFAEIEIDLTTLWARTPL